MVDGGTVDKTEVRLVMFERPLVVGVRGLARFPDCHEAASASVDHIAVSHEGELSERLASGVGRLEQIERRITPIDEGLDSVAPDTDGIDQKRVREETVRLVPLVPPRLAHDRGRRFVGSLKRLLESIGSADHDIGIEDPNPLREVGLA